MNGAHALLSTLRANRVTACFANPGTSEMHFVAGLDDVPEIRAVLCLFEGVATGAADGFARVTGTPAATLLHLGPGLANGWANLHNARRAHTPVLNIVGDHATYHAQYDAPLQSDISQMASTLAGWQRRLTDPNLVADVTAEAIAATYGPPGQVATLIVPSDVSWGEVSRVSDPWPVATRTPRRAVDDASIEHALTLLGTKRAALFVGGEALSAEHLALAHRVASASHSRVIMETLPSIIERGLGVMDPERLIYLSEFAIDQLRDIEALILIGAVEPVGFFAYPDVASRVVADGCEVLSLVPPGSDCAAALNALVDSLNAPVLPVTSGERPGDPTGELTTRTLAAAVGATMPEDLIVSDESISAIVHLFAATQFCPPHRWLSLTGGSIGFGLPVAVGAALGSGQRVLALESDGAMMYTPQALWTMAREGLDVTVIALSNRSYAILTLELQRVGAAGDGPSSQRMLELDNPALDLAGIARAQGVPSTRVTSADELVTALRRSYATPGPSFIEAVMPPGLS